MNSNETKRNLLILALGVLAFWIVEGILYYDSRKKRLLEAVFEKWGNDINDASKEFGIPKKRIASIIAQESSGDETAEGQAGEIGLMQILPGAFSETAKRYGADKWYNKTTSGIRSLASNPLWDGRTNIFVGTGYLKILKDRYGNLDNATKAYNSGSVFNDTAGNEYLNNVKSFERQAIL